MVTRDDPTPERKGDAEYSLARVQLLAARGSLNYGGTRVQVDVDNLGYGVNDVCDCLCALTNADFHHAERYTPRGRWHDVYLPKWAPTGSRADDLYVKFRLDDDVLVIQLFSFHLQR